jgi:hypothetical protein
MKNKKFDKRGNKIYLMCDQQRAQIDCKEIDCKFHNNGKCITIPAISLNNKLGICWSKIIE